MHRRSVWAICIPRCARQCTGGQLHRKRERRRGCQVERWYVRLQVEVDGELADGGQQHGGGGRRRLGRAGEQGTGRGWSHRGIEPGDLEGREQSRTCPRH